MGTIAIIGKECVIRNIGIVPRIAKRPEMSNVRTFLDEIRFICGKGDHNLIVDGIPGSGDLETWIRGAQSAGWACTDAALQHRSGWSVLRRMDTTLYVLVGQSAQSAKRCPLAPAGAGASQIAHDFEIFRHLIGIRWRINGGVTLHAAIRETFARKRPPLPGMRIDQREPLWHWTQDAPILGASSPMWRISHRSLAAMAREGDLTDVHQLDVRAQFLAAMAAAELPRGGLESIGECEFDPAQAGYWTIRCDQLDVSADRPALISRNRLSRRRAIITTPLMGMVASGYQNILWEMEDAFRPESSGRFLRKTAELIRDAQKFIHKPQFIEAFKQMYTEGIGMFASSGGMISRQDWRDTIVDLAVANLHRKIDKIPDGYQLLEVKSDSLYIAGPESPEGLKEAMTGPRIGNLRHVRSMPLKEYIERIK